MRVLLRTLFLAAGAAWLPSACAEAPGRRPNVLLVSIDSLRADVVGCYGAESPHAPGVSSSPNLDALAADGVRVEGAQSTTSWTLPSHLSILTGCPELVHGVDVDGDHLRDDVVSLAEALRRSGYRTAGFYSGPYLDERFGTGRGFERYERCYGAGLERATVAEGRMADAGGLEGSPFAPSRAVDVESHRDVSSERVAEAALEELERAAAEDRPWFLFAHFFDAHYDYIPPAPFDRLLDPEYAGDLDPRDFLTNSSISAPKPGGFGLRQQVLSDRDLEHVLALYGGELAWIDHQLGRLFERLDELGLAEDTLVVVTADHGDEFFENQGLGHRRTLRREVTEVPLVLRWPGVLPAGRTARGPVSLAGLMPTVLDLAGVEVPETAVGRSFAPLVRGTQERVDAPVLGRLVTFGYVQLELAGAPHRAVRLELRETFRDGPIKVLRRREWPEAAGPLPAAAREELRKLQVAIYKNESLLWTDLEANPRDVDAGYSADFSDPRARAALEAFQEEYERLVAARREGAGGTDTSSLQDELEALGYVVPTGFRIERQKWLVPPPPGAAADS